MILITGASRGIGRYLFQEYSKNHENVFGTFNSTPMHGKSDEKNYSHVEIGDLASVRRWIASLEPDGENIVLLNCAGTNYNSFAHKADMDKWSSVIQTNLIGTFNVIQTVLPFMRKAKYGRIINFSSIVAQKGIPGTSAYAASKTALWGLSRAVAIENAELGITINNLNLGYFDIGMISDVPQQFQEKIKNGIPVKKFGNPSEIKRAIDMIIQSDYLNGSSIDLNGGLF